MLTLRCAHVLGDAYIGCSIAVNGTCLTVVRFDAEGESGAGTFDVNMAPETLRRTNLGELHVGDGVNLERAAAANSRNSGHGVQGHVDDTGTVYSRRRDGDSLWVVVEAPARLMRYIVPKGYIAVDGTSLTVCDVDCKANTFSFMLVPHTQASVVIPRREVGHRVNLEVDAVAKYVEGSVGNLVERMEQLEAWASSKGFSLEGATAAGAAGGDAPAVAHQGAVPGMSVETVARAKSQKDEEMQEIERQTGDSQTVHGQGLEVGSWGLGALGCRNRQQPFVGRA